MTAACVAAGDVTDYS